ncbi:uncharacterized protein [Medicago truncatula]|uniref:RNA-binding (RRM/RBD/RNP motif) family protein n=1 Tax=Medicago truncatula TaxID=3880 RepID=G7JRI8_MEDTR|nr:uncharacterized protein LOC11406476 isoform X2 [Medicago truncatula]AES88710.2 RNA-binding (RRM/RBD/RNP motif) family protein [Medicago truncatula]
MSDEGERTCPLCAEEMDLTDQQLKPCRCGYEICVWCWHHIMDMAEKDDTDGRCPACRSPYDKEKIVGTAAKCERLLNEMNLEKKVKNQKAKSKSSDGRKQLSSVRVIQRNLVYIVGLPLDLADEDLLQKREYFGQYGKVLKVSMSRTAAGVIQQFPNETCSVYITYSSEEESIRCIQNVHGFILEGRPLRACFGTTKYCHAWLRNAPCINPDCLYLHEVGSQEDSFTKDEIISAYTSRVQQITGVTNSMQRRSGNVLPPPLDDWTNNSTEKPIVKSAPTNSVCAVRSSPPNGINGRHVSLPTSAAWGTQTTSCHPPVGGLSHPSVLSKPKPDTVNSMHPSVLSKPKPDTVNSALAFSTAVTGTIQASAAQCDGSRRPLLNDESRNTIPRVKSEMPKSVKQYISMDSLASASEKTSACDVSPVPVNLKNELSSRPLSRDSDRGNCTIANTLNATNITGHSFSTGPEEAVSATNEVIRNLSSEFSSINIDRSTSNELCRITKPSSLPTENALTKSPQIQEGSHYDVDRFKDPITTNTAGKTSTSVNGVFSPKEQCGGILDSQSQVVSDAADIEDDVTSFDNQRLKDPEVCLSYLPKATNFLNISKLSSPCLMQYGEPCTAGNDGSLSSNDRVRDESILHSSSMLCNGYPEKLISGSSNGLLRDERNRQSIGRLVGDAVDAGCDAAIDKGESSIISNILSLDFDPWDDSLTSPHNIVKLLGDNTDSQPCPLKTSSSRNVQSNNQSRFSFARQEESKIQSFDVHPSYTVSQQQPKSHILNQNLAERDFYMEKLGIANGFPTSNFEEAGVHSIASSNKLSANSRSQVSAPPGFSIPSRLPPPGFSLHERSDQIFDSLSGNSLLDHSSYLRNSPQTLSAGNIGGTGEIEFMDPAILAVGKGRLQGAQNSQSLDVRSNFMPQLNYFDNEARLQLLMQRSLAQQQNLRFSEIGNTFSQLGDSYGVSSRLDQSQVSNLAPYPQLSMQQSTNAILSNGQWNGWNEVQSGNGLGVAELLRNERLGFNKFYPGYDDSKYRMPNSGDIYNRTFGM